jgi:hypothetical protein
MWALMVVKQRFVWWPIHPMSLPISAMWMTDRIAWCVFVSWLLKLVILKYGGPRLFRQGKPLFIGFVAGHFTSMCSWTVIDAFTGMEGNFVFFL